MIRIKHDSILNAPEDILCHQVNCRGVMTAGVARALYLRWRAVRDEYIGYCKNADKAEDLLGKVQLVEVEPGKCVANIFGQLDCGQDTFKVYTDYEALEKAFQFLHDTCAGKSLAFPCQFGCGMAHGNWETVRGLIEKHLGDMEVTIYQIKPTMGMRILKALHGFMRVYRTVLPYLLVLAALLVLVLVGTLIGRWLGALG